jgi:hypothetical protein
MLKTGLYPVLLLLLLLLEEALLVALCWAGCC